MPYEIVVSQAIQAIKEISSDLVISPESDAYNEITKSYFSELERELKPAYFLTPKSTQQVSHIIKACKPFAGDLQIAICGAGQQATPGVANVRDGITIHLRNLKGVEVDTKKKIVSVAAGEKMGNVYEKLVTLGLGVAGNRHSSGGIGGDAVQGGLSYYSYSRGFICDDVVNYELVLASGEIVNANAHNNSDLFAALKGGGSNFGIVTRYDLQAFDQGEMWGGKIFYFEPNFPGQIQALVDYLYNPNAETDIHICLSLGYAAPMGAVLCMNDIFCLSPQKPKSLEAFAVIQPQINQMCTLRTGNLKSFTDEAYAGAAANRVVKMTTTVKADIGILEFAVKEFNSALEKLKDIKNLLFSLTFEPLPISMIEHSNARGANAIGLKPSDGPLVVILLYTSWDEASETNRVYSVNKEAFGNIETEAEAKDVSAAYRYLNYAFTHQDAFSSYGDTSKAELRKVSAKYDPDGFFQSAGAWPFKL